MDETKKIPKLRSARATSLLTIWPNGWNKKNTQTKKRSCYERLINGNCRWMPVRGLYWFFWWQNYSLFFDSKLVTARYQTLHSSAMWKNEKLWNFTLDRELSQFFGKNFVKATVLLNKLRRVNLTKYLGNSLNFVKATFFMKEMH